MFPAITSCKTLEFTIIFIYCNIFDLKILIHEMGKSCQTTQDEAGLTVIFLFYVQPWYKKQIQKKNETRSSFCCYCCSLLKSFPEFKNAMNYILFFSLINFVAVNYINYTVINQSIEDLMIHSLGQPSLVDPGLRFCSSVDLPPASNVQLFNS